MVILYAYTSGAANNGSPAHLGHINSNLKCFKCHYGTITDNTQDTVINVYDNHVNGVKNVLAVATGACDGLGLFVSGTGHGRPSSFRRHRARSPRHPGR